MPAKLFIALVVLGVVHVLSWCTMLDIGAQIRIWRAGTLFYLVFPLLFSILVSRNRARYQDWLQCCHALLL